MVWKSGVQWSDSYNTNLIEGGSLEYRSRCLCKMRQSLTETLSFDWFMDEYIIVEEVHPLPVRYKALSRDIMVSLTCRLYEVVGAFPPGEIRQVRSVIL